MRTLIRVLVGVRLSAAGITAFVAGVALFAALVLRAMPLSAQWNAPVGFPIDWSSTHVVYPPTHSYAEWLAVHQDPRALYQEMVRSNREMVRSHQLPARVPFGTCREGA